MNQKLARGGQIKITDQFGSSLAQRLSKAIKPFYPEFNQASFISAVSRHTANKTYTERITAIAEQLRDFLPQEYPEAINILLKMLGPENPKQTGMFKEFYWVLPIGKFIELYGLNHFDISMQAIGEITKRSTGEYAIRPYIRHNPGRALEYISQWAKSDNFHLRRLASEGLRPKLPWATKLDIFIEEPQPVFIILEYLKKDPVKFVQKSVANHLTDYLKVNPTSARCLIKSWQASDNKNTQWIVTRATRKIN